MNNDQLDFLAIGDIMTDAFIRIKEAHLNCSVNHEKCEICMDFGSKVPYESVTVIPAVGNSGNAAVCAARLGLKTAFLTDLGADRYGDEAIEALEKNRVLTNFVRKHEGIATNYHYVLWYGDDRTILIKHEEYPYSLPNIGSPRWIYFSSLGENSLPYHEQILNYLNAHPEIKLAFQPGTFQMKLGSDKLSGFYKRSDVFFCNKQEAQKILNNQSGEIKELIAEMQKLGPKIVVITDGKDGAYAAADGKIWFMPPYPDPKPPLERTGAGDSFSSTFTAALALGKSVPEALAWGPINSMSVVQYVGAQEGLLTREKLGGYLKTAPTSYAPQEI